MASFAPQNSVWSAMDYKPPRGRCNHKNSLISSCTCLRFMLHPVKAATSFECDGCGHHASFHSLENVEEDAILKKWSEQAVRAAAQPGPSAPPKRRRLVDKPADDIQILELSDHDSTIAATTIRSRSKNRTGKQSVPR